MPTCSQMRIPLTDSPSEFEDIVRSALKVRWNSPNLQRFGRNGQSQHGVDITGPDDLTRHVGVQCKSEEALTFQKIKAAAEKAEGFAPKLEASYLTTGTSRDGKLQQEVMLLSDQRRKEGKFPVGILFWEDLYEDLVTDVNEFAKHYPQFVPSQFLSKAGVRDVKAVLQVKVANQQFRAAQEVHSLRHDLTAHLPTWPDMEWGDVEEFIALDFDAYENRISDFLKSYGLVLDDDLKTLLTEAKSICSDGKFTVEMSEDGPQVSRDGHRLADRLYHVLEKAAEMARTWLREKDAGGRGHG
jgi:hypothetical protein